MRLTTSIAATKTGTLSGHAHGGQQPVSGAVIQLYAAGSGSAGTSATPLLSQAATTDANGNFNITGLYTCPSAATDVYLLASGGNPGLGSGKNNANLVLMTALGRCGNLSASVGIEVNELTTVAATYGLAPYMTSATAVAAPAASAQALDTAFQMAASLVNTNTGTPTGTSLTGAPVDIPKLLTLGNILSACVNTAGGVAGSPSACGQLFALTSSGGAVSDTVKASLQIDFQPSVNVSSIFGLNPSIAPFAPSLISPPADWNFVGVAPGTPLTVSGSLKSGLTGVSYSSSLNAAGGSGNYAWAVSSGTLPTGLQLNHASGAITGTPAVSGAASLTLAVVDAVNTANTASTQQTLLIANPLTASAASASGTVGTALTLALPADGGLLPYAWMISTGTMPAGLTLNSTTGVITGTPTAAGTFTFTVAVNDSTAPAEMASFPVTLTVAPANLGTTWYVRADGGTPYTHNNPTGQCDGKGDAAYKGSGVNQHCAFGDYRYLYDDQHTYPAPSTSTWVIAGGDTVVLDNTKQWRVGHDQGASSNDPWCSGTGSAICYNPTIPSGTALQPTRILGRNAGSCSTGAGRADASKMTQLFGGFGVYQTLNLAGTQYVDVECLEISSYTNCIVHGSPNPNPCHTNVPLSDFAQDGVEIDSNSAHVTMQDLYIHSVASYGIHGNIAHPITMNRVDVAYTGATGVNLDDGTEADSPDGSLTFNYGSIRFAGCAPEYPAKHAIPVTYCFDQNSGNNGDGLGTANVSGLDMHLDHDVFAYNTEDCIDPGHVYSGNHTLSVTNSIAYGCQGATFKWGAAFYNVTFENNISIANCARMSAPLTGAPTTYNQYLGLFCRAGDATSFNLYDQGANGPHSNILIANNTFVGTASVLFDVDCQQGGSGGRCPNSTLIFRNNIVRAYADTTSYGSYNAAKGPAGMTINGSIGNYVHDHNVYYGPMRNQACPPGGANEVCADPGFVNEPLTFVDETTLDSLNVALASGSAARGAGVTVSGLITDYTVKPYSAPPSIGALEYGSTY